MRARLVRIDLSDDARDFHATAEEPGVPMLDPANTNAASVSAWLGRFAAEPEWDGGSVRFYLAAEQQGGREQVACRPVTPKRLQGVLGGELELLRQAIESVKPKASMERVLHRCLSDTFRRLTADLGRSELGCYFFEYRDEQGEWRLVWCWGYQRADKEAGIAAICRKSACGLLYVGREGWSAKCPACYPEAASKKVKPGAGKRRAAVVLLLLLVALALAYWFLFRDAGYPFGVKARLEAAPDPLVVWLGEDARFERVEVAAGTGESPLAVDYRVAPAADQEVVEVVEVAGANVLRGLATGSAQLTVTAVDPEGPYDGLSTPVTVQVVRLERLSIEPARIRLQVGDTTAPLEVTGEGAGGVSARVPAALECADENILAPDAGSPGRFIARSLGGTSIRASFGGCEAFAEVSVTGDRFLNVDTKIDEHDEDFNVTIEVLAAGSEGSLEYRVYRADQTPPENWVPAENDGQQQHVALVSPPMRYGPHSARYHLVIEARDPADESVDRYPLAFRLVYEITRTDTPE